MASTKTAIEWTDKTWNPTVGCDKVSPGCKHCYAEAITKRFPRGLPNGFDFTLRPERLEEPKKWRKPSMVFVKERAARGAGRGEGFLGDTSLVEFGGGSGARRQAPEGGGLG
jgi:DNA repair photolyase